MAAEDLVDFYQLDDLLEDKEKNIRDAVRAFVDQECMPIITDHFDKGTFPMKLIPRLGELGLFGDLTVTQPISGRDRGSAP